VTLTRDPFAPLGYFSSACAGAAQRSVDVDWRCARWAGLIAKVFAGTGDLDRVLVFVFFR
jgi:hypothetical protein